MNMDTLLFSLAAFTIASYGVSLVYTVGIVWRVEMELDLAYKFLATAVFFLLAAEILNVVPSVHAVTFWTVVLWTTKFLAALCLFFGMFFMRDLIQKMDGEKQQN